MGFFARNLALAVAMAGALLTGPVAQAQTQFRATAGCPALGSMPANITADELRCRCYDLCSGSDSTPQAPRPQPQQATPAPSPPAAQPPSGQSYSFIVGLNPTGDNFLSLRDAPNGRELRRMGPETLFTELGREGNWVNVRLRSGETGWAFARYIACCKAASATPASTRGLHYLVGLNVNGDNWLALRSEPHMRGVRLMRMGPETLLTVVGREDGWLNVRLTTGETGWAYGDFIACCR